MSNQILNPLFLTSASHIKQCPEPNCLEIVCLGRSNVGKSSFINLFLGKQGLAKSSSTPGKTQLINFFGASFKNADEEIPFKLIDLPGFGYAKVSKEMKKNWEYNLMEFLCQRKSVKLFLHLIDSRHLNLENDVRVREFLLGIKNGDQTILEIFTKADKLNNQQKSRLLSMGKILTSTLAHTQKTTPITQLREMIIFKALGRE